MVMESTYGDRRHGDRNYRIERLGEVLNNALADGGKVFVRAFSLGTAMNMPYNSPYENIDVCLCVWYIKK